MSRTLPNGSAPPFQPPSSSSSSIPSLPPSFTPNKDYIKSIENELETLSAQRRKELTDAAHATLSAAKAMIASSDFDSETKSSSLPPTSIQHASRPLPPGFYNPFHIAEDPRYQPSPNFDSYDRTPIRVSISDESFVHCSIDFIRSRIGNKSPLPLKLSSLYPQLSHKITSFLSFLRELQGFQSIRVLECFVAFCLDSDPLTYCSSVVYPFGLERRHITPRPLYHPSYHQSGVECRVGFRYAISCDDAVEYFDAIAFSSVPYLSTVDKEGWSALPGSSVFFLSVEGSSHPDASSFLDFISIPDLAPTVNVYSDTFNEDFYLHVDCSLHLDGRLLVLTTWEVKDMNTSGLSKESPLHKLMLNMSLRIPYPSNVPFPPIEILDPDYPLAQRYALSAFFPSCLSILSFASSLTRAKLGDRVSLHSKPLHHSNSFFAIQSYLRYLALSAFTYFSVNLKEVAKSRVAIETLEALCSDALNPLGDMSRRRPVADGFRGTPPGFFVFHSLFKRLKEEAKQSDQPTHKLVMSIICSHFYIHRLCRGYIKYGQWVNIPYAPNITKPIRNDWEYAHTLLVHFGVYWSDYLIHEVGSCARESSE